jgi:hypothetical protein
LTKKSVKYTLSLKQGQTLGDQGAESRRDLVHQEFKLAGLPEMTTVMVMKGNPFFFLPVIELRKRGGWL